MDDIFEAIDGGDFAGFAFVAAADDEDFVVFANGDCADLTVDNVHQPDMICKPSWTAMLIAVNMERAVKLNHTLCLSRSSLLRGALMMVRRTPEGALKCAFRDFLREEWRAAQYYESV